MSFVRNVGFVLAAGSLAACAGTAAEPAPVPAPAPAAAAPADTADPRVGLAAGWRDAGTAAKNVELVAHVDRPEGFYDAAALGNLLLGNTDMAFEGNRLFLGSFHGFNVYDIADPSAPRLVTSYPCPGGQGDLSVHGNLLFMSVEMPNGRLDCGMNAPTENSSPDRIRGVRIFDISDIASPRQVAAVQTCRGSHTHTLVTDPDDDANVYIYVSGTSPVRPATELEGCSGGEPDTDPNTALFRIEVIQVPLAAPATARIVSTPRVFADAEGNIAGLWLGGPHGPGTQDSRITNQCHDITVFADAQLAAGACSGNGILLDISNPAEPVRIDQVVDPNFAYWHSATFNDDATRVIFTDEWGGGTAARCLATDDPEWGANAIFELENGKLRLAGYYKLPAPQTESENCVAHNGSTIPVPGRDIMAQAWYQGGMSIFDFTDPANPVEIAYFDRGPLDAGELLIGGHWSTYWYNGRIYGSEIARGLDVFALEPSEHLTENEIEAAKLVQWERFNPQHQTRVTWPASFVVARALLDQLRRGSSAGADRVTALAAAVARAETLLRLGEQVRGLGIPIVVTDGTGRVTAAANTPLGDAALEDPRLRAYAAELDRQNPPIVEPAIGTIHYGVLPVGRLLTTLAVLQALTLAVMVGVAVFVYRTGMSAQRDRLWVAMAREAAHQLGTPLTSLQGWIEALRSRPTPPAGLADHLAADAERLDRVAQRFERIGNPARRDVIGLGALADRVAGYFRPRLPRHANPIEMRVEATGPGPDVTGDPVLLEWTLEALVKNAIDALQGRAGTIILRVGADEAWGELRVIDDGPGVPRDIRRSLFEPGITTKRGGWGIGLALSRRVVRDMHGGELTLEQTERGASFLLRIPLTDPRA